MNSPWGVWHLCILEVVSKDWENYCEPGWYPREISGISICSLVYTLLSLFSYHFPMWQGPVNLISSQKSFSISLPGIPHSSWSGSFILWALIELLSYLHRSMSCFSIRVAVFHTHGSPPPTKWWVPVNKHVTVDILVLRFLIAVKIHNIKHTIVTIFNLQFSGAKYIHIVVQLSPVIHLLNFHLPKLKFCLH